MIITQELNPSWPISNAIHHFLFQKTSNMYNVWMCNVVFAQESLGYIHRRETIFNHHRILWGESTDGRVIYLTGSQ